MLVKDLPKEVKLSDIKIKLTSELKAQYEEYSSKGEDEMYLVGPMMGDWFISPSLKVEGESRTIYPMPEFVEPSDFLECEVIEPLIK